MQTQQLPFTRDLVLIGGGHTHALVLRSWMAQPLPGTRLTLIDPAPAAAYSGMLPGFVAGHYARNALDIDLVRLARAAGARFLRGEAVGIDRARGTIVVTGQPPIAYDAASIDIGITSAMPDLPGFSAHAVPAKPLAPFADAWARFRAGRTAARIAIIGGGVAGAELALAMRHAMHTDARTAEVTLLDRGRALSGLGARARCHMRAALQNAGIVLLENATPQRIEHGAIHLKDGHRIEADFITGAAGARPHAWLADTGLTDAAGFVAVDDRLRSADPAIFAVGDCATMVATPRPKAGVYAVRQAPVLFENLRATLACTGVSRRYRPQRDYLKLVSLGGKAALGERLGLTFAGPAIWRWKDRIDRRFMARLNDLAPPPAPALPWPRARGLRETMGAVPFCGGCGAKIGAAALHRGLGPEESARDDAAIVTLGDTRQVISTDHLRALVDDPVMMTRVAAIHALGDIWAMGATPHVATVSAILPRCSPALAERTLAEIMHAARATLGDAGARIVGGHSTLGAELTIGFTLTGLCHAAPITLAGAQPGDALLLTKPLGSGIVMAADMRLAAPGRVVAEALDVMTQSQADASRLLAGARAMTDVTGFGLLGHLSGLCAASGCGARIHSADVPVMAGAEALAARGIRSSLHAQNRGVLPGLDDTDPRAALLFDPQTGGGLLAAVPPTGADDTLRALQAAGYTAARIGTVTEAPGQIEVV